MFHKAVPLLVAISLVLAACGSASQSEASTSVAKGAEETAHGGGRHWRMEADKLWMN